VSTDRLAPAGQSNTGGSALIRLLRPRQWSKNLLVFAAAAFANQLFVPKSAGLAALAFVAFCLASSSVYVINDLLDVERDRQHPKKRLRPIAAGEISPRAAIRIAIALTLASLGIALWVSWELATAIAIYIALVHFYSMVGKHIVILDTMLVAAGFVLRAVGGAIAIDVPSSSWFVLCTFFAALFLALAKRRAEMLALSDGAGDHRSVLGEYTESTLSAYTSAVIAATTISYALYVIDSADRFRLLPLTVPFVLFAVFRYHHLVETAGLGERPEDVFLGDRAFQTGVVAFLAAALAAIYWGA
jgi:4-hydroxybenzoate polyprenyltransferase